jgi:hypothetical protein
VTDELTPEQETAVRRLLAEARHDGPVPADVAARLDAVLGDLSAEPASSPVTDLAGARRRRQNAGRLLLAAAAVVVAGVGVGQLVGSTTGADSDMSSAGGEAAPRDDSGGDTADEGAAPGAVESEQDGPGEEGAQPPTATSSGATDRGLLDQLNAPINLSSDSFALDVERNLRDATAARRSAAFSDLDGVLVYARDRGFVCRDANYGEGAKLPAYYDAEEAVLVLRRPSAGIQRVDLLACGTAAVVATTDLPAR